ncbi:MAG TPA: Ig domain-containing protein [Terriglobia bacterium]|nr:Ig domain-containing protein [Terriglobia bacterium]
MSRFKLGIATLVMVLVLASSAFSATTISISPTSATAGSGSITLTVNGSFGSGSMVLWNGVAQSTVGVSSTQLSVTVPATLLATAGTVSIAVRYPSTVTKTSTTYVTTNSVTFTILAPATTSSTTTTTNTTASPLAISTTSVPIGTTGTAYSANLTATGGTAPYTWSVSSGALPAGLTLSAAGAISGTPTTSGSYSFVGAVKDSASNSASYTYSTSIAMGAPPTPPLAISTTSVPAGTTGTAYSATLAATGGTSPYSWTLSSGTLPTGLTLSSTGAISGTPTASGSYSFTAQVSDSASHSATYNYSISSAAPLGITTTSIGPGYPGQAYSATLAATGGTAPYTWSFMGVSLPPGLTLSAAGVISGTPTASGSFPFPVQVTDSASRTASYTFTATVPGTLAFASYSNGVIPGSEIQGSAYSIDILATGGFTPLSCSVASGSALPTGLNVSASSANTCRLSAGVGMVTAAPGNYTFSLQATDTAGHIATKAYTLAVVAPPSTGGLTISTTSPPSPHQGTPYSSTLTASGATPPYTWTYEGVSLPPGLTLSAAGVISGTPTSSGTFPFPVQVGDSASHVVSYTFSVSVIPPLYLASYNSGVLPGATSGAAYSTDFLATGGFPPVTWSVPSGSTLPAGLALSPASANVCYITGTVTAPAGTYTFSLQATDSNGNTSTRVYSLTVAAP